MSVNYRLCDRQSESYASHRLGDYDGCGPISVGGFMRKDTGASDGSGVMAHATGGDRASEGQRPRIKSSAMLNLPGLMLLDRMCDPPGSAA